MVLVPIPPSANTLPDAKGIINENTGEVELRLQDLETLSFMRSGEGEPENAQFNNDDYYINTEDYSLWHKSNGVWAFETSLAGNPGPAGPAGTPGLNHRGVWASATAYSTNDAVRYRGSYWRAVKFVGDGTEPTTANTASWQVVARGINSLGSWAAGQQYRVDDLVRYDGEWYILTGNILSSTTPNNDTTNYQKVVTKGDPGPQGEIGPQGPEGPQGQQGPIGAGLINRGAWSSALAYVANDAVSYKGAFWSAKQANTNVEPRETGVGQTNWQKLVRGINPMAAAWSSTAQYWRDDVVPYTDGSQYIALNDVGPSATPPSTDTSNWRVFAARGLQGTQGPQGIPGPQGETGPTPTTYEWYKFFRGGVGMSGPITGVGWDRVTAPSSNPRTITAMYVRIDGWSAQTADALIRVVGRQNDGGDVTIGEVTLNAGSAQKRGQATNLLQQVDDTWDLRVDLVSGGAINNLSVIVRGQ